jgi:hypothetical protein
MFDIFNFKDARENPLLAAEFIKIVPAYELTKHLLKTHTQESEDGRDELLVDLEPVRDGILASDRDDLKLVLATYGKVMELWETRALEQLFVKGPAFKAALLSNSRIDWYRLSLRNDAGNNILQNTLSADLEEPVNKSLLYAMVRNPRMDRTVIADAMCGKKGFETLPIGTRLLIGAEAIGVEEIPAEFWAGKDSPDSHEIYFTRVNAAFVRMIKDAKEALDAKTFNSYLTGLLLWKLPKASLDVRAEDWLTAEEIQSIEEKITASSKFMESYNRKQRAALYKVFEYFADWYDRDDGYPQTTALISTAGVAILTMSSLMRSHAVAHDIEKITEEMLTSPHLIIRAAGYATIFNNITVESNSPAVKSFFTSYPDNTLEKWMGITNTTAFWLCDGYDSLRNTIREEMAGSGYDVKIESARDDMYQYLFCSGSFAERLAAHNKTTRPSLFKPKSMASRVIHTAFSVDETKMKSAQSSQGILGKLFK